MVVNETFPPSDRSFQFVFPEYYIGPHRDNADLIGRTLKFEIDGSFLFIFEVPYIDKLILIHLLLLLEFLLAEIFVIKGVANGQLAFSTFFDSNFHKNLEGGVNDQIYVLTFVELDWKLMVEG